LHPNILFDLRTPGELERVIEAGAATLRACIELGGSITGEHGVGLEKRPTSGFSSTKPIWRP
jgi:glycolate oxidase